MTLQNLQAEFADSLFSEDMGVDLIQPIQNIIIYRNHVTSHLIDALQDTYPMISRLVGNDFFRITAKEYSQKYPSRSSNLHDYGEYFSDFLAEYQPVKDLIYLAEVASFEWLCHLLYFAADETPFNIKLLETISPDDYDQIHFTLHPACRVMKFHYPMLRIVELCKGDSDEMIDLSDGEIHLLIIRRHLDISLVTLSIAEFTFLHALQDNKTLAEALDETMKVDANFKLDEKLPVWIRDKTIVDCYSHA